MIFEFEGFGFKFGTYAAAETQAISGKSIGSLFAGMKDESSVMISLIHYFYGAAKSYNLHKGINKEINLDTIGDMIDKIGYEKAMQVITESLQMPKNSEAPMTETGQK